MSRLENSLYQITSLQGEHRIPYYVEMFQTIGELTIDDTFFILQTHKWMAKNGK